MKKLILPALMMLVSISLAAQDSLTMNVGPVKFRARDLETMFPVYRNAEDVGLQLLLDSVVSKYAVNPPALSDTVRIDSVERGAIIQLGLWVRTKDHQMVDNISTNVKNCIALLNDPYINNYFITYDASIDAMRTDSRQRHRQALRRKRN